MYRCEQNVCASVWIYPAGRAQHPLRPISPLPCSARVSSAPHPAPCPAPRPAANSAGETPLHVATHPDIKAMLGEWDTSRTDALVAQWAAQQSERRCEAHNTQHTTHDAQHATCVAMCTICTSACTCGLILRCSLLPRCRANAVAAARAAVKGAEGEAEDAAEEAARTQAALKYARQVRGRGRARIVHVGVYVACPHLARTPTSPISASGLSSHLGWPETTDTVEGDGTAAAAGTTLACPPRSWRSASLSTTCVWRRARGRSC